MGSHLYSPKGWLAASGMWLVPPVPMPRYLMHFFFSGKAIDADIVALSPDPPPARSVGLRVGDAHIYASRTDSAAAPVAGIPVTLHVVAPKPNASLLLYVVNPVKTPLAAAYVFSAVAEGVKNGARANPGLDMLKEWGWEPTDQWSYALVDRLKDPDTLRAFHLFLLHVDRSRKVLDALRRTEILRDVNGGYKLTQLGMWYLSTVCHIYPQHCRATAESYYFRR